MTRALTTLLSPTEVGRYSILTSTINITTMVLINPVGMFVNRRLHAWSSAGTLGPRLKVGLAYLIGVVLALVAFLVAVPVGRWFGLQITLTTLIVIVCGTVLINTINTTLIPTLNMLGHPRAFVSLTAITQWSALGGAVLASLCSAQAENWLMGSLAGLTISTVVSFALCVSLLGGLRGAPVGIRRSDITRVLAFSWPIVISVSLSWAQSQSYRLAMGSGILGAGNDLPSLGLLVAGFGLGNAVVIAFEQVMAQFLQPNFYAAVETRGAADQGKAWNAYASGLFPGCLLNLAFIISAAPYLARLLLGPAFRSATSFIMWGGISETSRALASGLGLIAHAKRDTVPLIVPSMAGAAFSIAGVAALGPTLHGFGIAVALASANVAFAGAMYLSVRSKLPILLPWRRLAYAITYALPLVMSVATSSWTTSLWALVPIAGYTALMQLLLLREVVTGRAVQAM